MSTYYRNIHTGAVFLPPEDVALSGEWEPVEGAPIDTPPAESYSPLTIHDDGDES